LIGPNGAGKTTFIDAISGIVRSEGRVELDGADLTNRPPHVRARRGLARTWQSIELFDDLSVSENLLVASHRPPVWRMIKETVTPPKPWSAETGPVLELLGLESTGDRLPTDLSQGQRKLVGIARALVAKPRIVCLATAAGSTPARGGARREASPSLTAAWRAGRPRHGPGARDLRPRGRRSSRSSARAADISVAMRRDRRLLGGAASRLRH
jgi:ABC-type branched-subunit amino acid transport system ATPase component